MKKHKNYKQFNNLADKYNNLTFIDTNELPIKGYDHKILGDKLSGSFHHRFGQIITKNDTFVLMKHGYHIKVCMGSDIIQKIETWFICYVKKED